MPGPYFEDLFNSLSPTTGLNARKGIVTVAGAAATAGGQTVPGVVLGSTVTGAGVGIYFGNGTPTISAPQGSLYLNTTGSSVSTRLFVNTNGTTGWTAVTTAT